MYRLDSRQNFLHGVASFIADHQFAPVKSSYSAVSEIEDRTPTRHPRKRVSRSASARAIIRNMQLRTGNHRLKFHSEIQKPTTRSLAVGLNSRGIVLAQHATPARGSGDSSAPVIRRPVMGPLSLITTQCESYMLMEIISIAFFGSLESKFVIELNFLRASLDSWNCAICRFCSGALPQESLPQLQSS